MNRYPQFSRITVAKDADPDLECHCRWMTHYWRNGEWSGAVHHVTWREAWDTAVQEARHGGVERTDPAGATSVNPWRMEVER